MKILPVSILTLLLASCGSSPKNDEEEDKSSQPRTQIVGRIASVSKTGQFVLIQKYGPGLLPPDAIYQSRGRDDRTASLRPSGERIRDFFAADLLSGNARRGDAVIAYSRPPEEPEELEEETPVEDDSASRPDLAEDEPTTPVPAPENPQE